MEVSKYYCGTVYRLNSVNTKELLNPSSPPNLFLFRPKGIRLASSLLWFNVFSTQQPRWSFWNQTLIPTLPTLTPFSLALHWAQKKFKIFSVVSKPTVTWPCFLSLVSSSSFLPSFLTLPSYFQFQTWWVFRVSTCTTPALAFWLCCNFLVLPRTAPHSAPPPLVENSCWSLECQLS